MKNNSIKILFSTLAIFFVANFAFASATSTITNNGTSIDILPAGDYISTFIYDLSTNNEASLNLYTDYPMAYAQVYSGGLYNSNYPYPVSITNPEYFVASTTYEVYINGACGIQTAKITCDNLMIGQDPLDAFYFHIEDGLFVLGQYIPPLPPIPPQVASVAFSFIDASSSEHTGAGVQSIVIGGTTSLWPIVLIIVGLILVFYIYPKIIELFKFKNKK